MVTNIRGPCSGQVHEFQLFTNRVHSLSLQVGNGDNQFTAQNFVAPFATLEGSPVTFDATDVKVSKLAVLGSLISGGRGVWLQFSYRHHRGGL